jgi:ADP-ribose pyrophosphatase
MVDYHPHLDWTEVSRRHTARYALFDIYTTRRTSTKGHDSDFILVDSPDWVTIIPYDEGNDSFSMVRQFRHGSGTVTLEFPAGVVGRAEAHRDAASRELLEETGCVAGRLVHAGSVNPNPAFMTNEVHTWIATELICGRDLELDENELLDVEEVPVREVIDNLGKPPFTNGIMVISLTWFLRATGR